MIRVFRHECQLANPFGIARETKTTVPVVLAHVDGGWGEASPLKFYGESADSAAATLEKYNSLDLPDLDQVEDVIDAVEAAIPGEAAARCALDIALWDRLGRRLGAPLWKMFGKGPTRPMVTSFTIGIDTMETMLRKADEAAQYSILKIKLGRDVAQDLAFMTELRRRMPEKTLRVDANAGYSLDDALRAAAALADLGVEYLEQPLARGAFDDLKRLKDASPMPIFVDEDSHTARDLPRLAGIVDGINIKLMKTGGITEARRMIALARTLGMRVMIGCMIETAVGITAAGHLAPYADNLDLDGNLLTVNDPFTGLKCSPDGTLTLPDGPGLGVELRPEYADRFA